MINQYALSKRGQYLSVNTPFVRLRKHSANLRRCSKTPASCNRNSHHSITPLTDSIFGSNGRNKSNAIGEPHLTPSLDIPTNPSSHAYAWVYVDFELSLLHDLPPILSINDLQVPLPHENQLWNASSYSNWLEASGIQGIHGTPSLNSFFRSFLQGRLTGNEDLPVHHLRLLLHPLQAMVLEQQQLLRIFDTDEPSNRYRVLSKIKILGRLQETQNMLQDLATLLNRSPVMPATERGAAQEQTAKCVSMIMLHLVSLNVFTSIPEIEKCAREEPPASNAARAEVWRRARYPEGEGYVLFHAGQIFRLLDNLMIDARPTWWPVALYRASMACWALRSLDGLSPGLQQPEVNIDAILPSEEERSHNTTAGIPVVTLSDGRRMAILEGSNSLIYCINKLEGHPSHLARGIMDKVRFCLDRWSY